MSLRAGYTWNTCDLISQIGGLENEVMLGAGNSVTYLGSHEGHCSLHVLELSRVSCVGGESGCCSKVSYAQPLSGGVHQNMTS